MKRIFALLFAMTVCLGAAPYPQMAPLSQYLMDRQAEIDLALSAAPASISSHASVLVLTPKGYVTAVKGSNGFTCLVERSWDNPFEAPEFWNPKIRAAVCNNAAASRSVMQYVFFRASLALAGVSKEQMFERIKAAVAANQLPVPEWGSMAYMMSKGTYLGDSAKAWHPHVMVYAPKGDGANAGAAWGANLSGSPIVFDPRTFPEPGVTFFIPIATWSDGTPEKPM